MTFKESLRRKTSPFPTKHILSITRLDLIFLLFSKDAKVSNQILKAWRDDVNLFFCASVLKTLECKEELDGHAQSCSSAELEER